MRHLIAFLVIVALSAAGQLVLGGGFGSWSTAPKGEAVAPARALPAPRPVAMRMAAERQPVTAGTPFGWGADLAALAAVRPTVSGDAVGGLYLAAADWLSALAGHGGVLDGDAAALRPDAATAVAAAWTMAPAAAAASGPGAAGGFAWTDIGGRGLVDLAAAIPEPEPEGAAHVVTLGRAPAATGACPAAVRWLAGLAGGGRPGPLCIAAEASAAAVGFVRRPVPQMLAFATRPVGRLL